jgi:hypothetical protein
VFINLTNPSGESVSISIKRIVAIKDRSAGGAEIYARGVGNTFYVKESHEQILSMIQRNTNGST